MGINDWCRWYTPGYLGRECRARAPRSHLPLWKREEEQEEEEGQMGSTFNLKPGPLCFSANTGPQYEKAGLLRVPICRIDCSRLSQPL